MTTPTDPGRRRAAWPQVLRRAALVAALAALSAAPSVAASDPAGAWTALTAQERSVLEPLRDDWPSINLDSRRKWLLLAERFPTLESKDQVRIRARMAEWSRLTPTERQRAREQFFASRDWPARERQERWQAYQALTPEQRQALARTAVVAAPAPAVNLTAAAALPRSAPIAAVPTRPHGPAPVQVRPGATTMPMAVPAAPPAHQQPGLPKIAATPTFVDPATLLPRRGPQAAAMVATRSATIVPAVPSATAPPTPVAPSPASTAAPAAPAAPRADGAASAP